ncbi:hypothetical protein BJ165DRAFT_1478779 [Panaeolus papilionaceus]|nr:hypothetical protein BJ165DRAFT_1478779 [Panaeolus papilionaceus]
MFTSFTTTRTSSQQASSSSNPKQNSERLFGELSSTYGLPSRSSSPSPKSTCRGDSHYQSATSATSSVSSPGSTKNYEETYGNLASLTGLGFGAGVPALSVPRTHKKPKTGSAASTPSTLSRVASSAGSHTSSHKDYEHGFGHLATTYELGRSYSGIRSVYRRGAKAGSNITKYP